MRFMFKKLEVWKFWLILLFLFTFSCILLGIMDLMRFVRNRVQTAAAGINENHPFVLVVFHRMCELRRFDFDIRQVQYHITTTLTFFQFIIINPFLTFPIHPHPHHPITIPAHNPGAMQTPSRPALLHQIPTHIFFQLHRLIKMPIPF